MSGVMTADRGKTHEAQHGDHALGKTLFFYEYP